jgi:hypothetical protein
LSHTSLKDEPDAANQSATKAASGSSSLEDKLSNTAPKINHFLPILTPRTPLDRNSRNIVLDEIRSL